MKTIWKIKNLVMVCVVGMVMGSCLGSSNDNFAIGMGVTMLQQVSEVENDGEIVINNRFLPLVTVLAYESIASVSVKDPSGSSITMASLDDTKYVYQSNYYMADFCDTIPYGYYTASAQSFDEDYASASYSFSSTTKGMKSKLKGEVSLENKKITARFNEVENATGYLIIATTSIYNVLSYSNLFVIKEYTTSQMGDWGELEITITDSQWNSIPTGVEYRVYLAAISDSGTVIQYGSVAENTIYKQSTTTE